MPLSSNTRLGAYVIADAIGKGGMGEVYRARDTRLPRDVAIKVSAERFSERFAREAEVIASLNHPNITTLFDVGPNYLVMELVDGVTLAERIRERPLTLEEASAIASQIVDALDYAHDRGVVHRDLKPGNVKIRSDGLVKVLDFGLAKATLAAAGDSAATMTAPQTEVGMVLGTPAYMSPEQARGKTADKRADIWAFGCVFYEMLTGVPPHQGESTQETVASILRDQPDLSKVPPQARRLLRRCLEKDPHKRLRHIGDAMSLLDEPSSGEQIIERQEGRRHPRRAVNRRWVWPAVAALAIAVAGFGAYRTLATPGERRAPIRFDVTEAENMKFFYGGAMTVSPDGRWLVFPATGTDGVTRYWIRSLDTVEARELPGTETAYVPAGWSADSRYVLFSGLAGADIQKIDIQGGEPQKLVQMTGRLNGITANRDGVLLYGSSAAAEPIFRASLSGSGAAMPVTAVPAGQTGHKFPQFLPDGRHFLYLRPSSDPDVAGVYVGSIDLASAEQSTTRLLATNRQAYFAPGVGGQSGHLLFLRESTLMAQPFDPARLELSGEPVPVAQNVESFPSQWFGMFSVSEEGTLVYRSTGGTALVPTWFDDRGRPLEKLGEAADYVAPALSPDESQIAMTRRSPSGSDIVILDVRTGAVTPFTFDPAPDRNPIWSPDGRFIVFRSSRGGRERVFIKPADGSSQERVLTEQGGIPTSWAQEYLLLTSVESAGDVWVVPNPTTSSGPVTAVKLPGTRAIQGQAQLSPDAQWLAYMTPEETSSSAMQVFVRPFRPSGGEDSGARWSVSSGRLAAHPRWRADGRQLFFVSVNTFDIMVVDIDTSAGFRASQPRAVFAAPAPLLPVEWQLSRDARRFLFITTPDGGRPAPFRVVVNWASTLQQ